MNTYLDLTVRKIFRIQSRPLELLPHSIIGNSLLTTQYMFVTPILVYSLGSDPISSLESLCYKDPFKSYDNEFVFAVVRELLLGQHAIAQPVTQPVPSLLKMGGAVPLANTLALNYYNTYWVLIPTLINEPTLSARFFSLCLWMLMLHLILVIRNIAGLEARYLVVWRNCQRDSSDVIFNILLTLYGVPL